MRDLLFLVALCGVLPFAFRLPWVGVLAWCWVALMNPHQLTYSHTSFPAAQLVGIATLAGFLVFHENTRKLPLRFPTWLLLALWGWAAITTWTALEPAAAWPALEQMSKMMLFVFLSLMLFQDLRRLRWLLWVVVGCIAFFGVKGAIFAILSGGQHIVFGPPNSRLYDNNELALALNMILPLTVFFARSATGRLGKIGWSAVAVCTVLAVLFTYSRGGVVTLAAVIGFTLLRSRQRLPALAVAVLVLVAALLFAPPQWTARVQSIGDYEADASVNGRFNSWWFSWNLAMDRPLLGGGFGVFTRDNFAVWAPDPDTVFVAHSIYFDMLATMGFPGLTLLLLLLATMMWRTEVLRRLAREQHATWFAGCAEALQIAVVAFAVGGAFLSQSWSDLFYHFVGALIVVEVLAAPLRERRPQPQLATWRREVTACAA